MFISTVTINDMSAVTYETSVGTDKMPSDEMLVDTMSHEQKTALECFC
jgi:hypothetical protein